MSQSVSGQRPQVARVAAMARSKANAKREGGRQINVWLSPLAAQMLDALCDYFYTNQTKTMERLIRDTARELGLEGQQGFTSAKTRAQAKAERQEAERTARELEDVQESLRAISAEHKLTDASTKVRAHLHERFGAELDPTFPPQEN